jgi:flagellar P-ring protein FlgI
MVIWVLKKKQKNARRLLRLLLAVGCFLGLSSALTAEANERHVLIRDVTDIQGVRDNQLVGYGLVVGLRGTGDRQQTFFTVQTLANTLQRMGVQIAPGVVVVKNVAAVFVTAKLPPFTRPGMPLDVTVSSIGDAKSLEGGVLLMTALRAPDGQVYAEAQGPLTLAGYSEGAGGQAKSVNHPTVGVIPNGAVAERDASVDLSHFRTISLLLHSSDFSASRAVADAINKDFAHPVASAVDGRRIDIDVPATGLNSVPLLISRVQNLSVRMEPPAKVIMNERTGTIVMGGDVKLTPVSVIHGNLTIQVVTTPIISQPAPLSSGTTTTAQQTTLTVKDPPAQSIELEEGANVETLIRGLHSIGATSRDVIGILQAIKEAGGLQAELEVI